jgi:hypothetical protein
MGYSFDEKEGGRRREIDLHSRCYTPLLKVGEESHPVSRPHSLHATRTEDESNVISALSPVEADRPPPLPPPPSARSRDRGTTAALRGPLLPLC